MALVVDNEDVEFYEAVHRALEQAYAGDRRIDQRGASRHDYVCRQQIAESHDWSLPSNKTAYQSVLCYDLAVGGFSFLTLGVPRSSRLIVRLAGDSRLIHMRAQVVHVTTLMVEGVIWQKVGCRFVGRPLHSS